MIRPPTIVKPPAGTPLPEAMSCEVLIKVGEKVTTDEIIAAYGDDLVALLDAVTAAITTAELSALNKSYGIDATDADTLAHDWLVANGFLSD